MAAGQSVHKKPILFTAALSSPTRPLPRPEGSPLVNSDKPGAHSKMCFVRPAIASAAATRCSQVVGMELSDGISGTNDHP